MHPLDGLREWLEEKGETLGGIGDHIVGALTEFVDDFKGPFVDESPEALRSLREYMEHEAEGAVRLIKYVRQTDEFRVIAGVGIEVGIAILTKRLPKLKTPLGALDFGPILDQVHQGWRDEYKREFEPEPIEIQFAPEGETNRDRVQGVRITTAMLKKAADQRERRQYLLPQDWDLEILPNQRLTDLQELGLVSGTATAQTLLLGDTLVHDLAPALSGATDSLTPADIAFGEMDMGYDDLRWVSDATLEGLTVNAAAMSGAVTPWAAGVTELVEQRRRELEAYRPLPRPVPRPDSPPGGGPSGGGLSWDEGVDLYQIWSGETAENIAWIRQHPDDRAQSGENVEWTFRDIVRDAVRRSGEVPLFAMGGVVPGVFGAPVPAIVHGGEEIVGPGNGGGVPINLEVHVHGTVISEGDLARNVRDGLMRRFD